MWKEVIQVLGPYAIFPIALAWFLKYMISHTLKKDMAVFQDMIEKAQHKYSSIYDKRIELIPELHYHLNIMYGHAQTIIAASKASQSIDTEYVDNIIKDSHLFLKVYLKSRLYLDTNQVTKIDEVFANVANPIMSLKFSESKDNATQTYGYMLSLNWNKVIESTPNLLDNLEKAFRSSIGTN